MSLAYCTRMCQFMLSINVVNNVARFTFCSIFCSVYILHICTNVITIEFVVRFMDYSTHH